jgi:hypothetical protein
MTVCFAICCLFAFACSRKVDHRNTPEATSATSVVDAVQQIEEYIKVGEQRPFTAWGPEFQLPPSYFEYVQQHPEPAMGLLRQKLASDNANVRCNAYDFLIHLAEVPSFRSPALDILDKAVKEEGFAIQQYLRPAIQRLTSGAASKPA